MKCAVYVNEGKDVCLQSGWCSICVLDALNDSPLNKIFEMGEKKQLKFACLLQMRVTKEDDVKFGYVELVHDVFSLIRYFNILVIMAG